MDVAVKARRSQALIDSIEELIALERDVSLATECCNTTAAQPQQVIGDCLPPALTRFPRRPGFCSALRVSYIGLQQERPNMRMIGSLFCRSLFK